MTSIGFAVSIAGLERGLNPAALDAAKAQGEAYWSDNGARAMKENGCG
jgi:hypothetical protein